MIVLGAKGHAKDLLVVLNETANEDINFTFFDDFTKPEEHLFLGEYLILHNFSEIDFSLNPRFVSAIGGPILRRQMVEKFVKAGGIYKTVISNQAAIGSLDVNIGKGCNIMPFVFISNNVQIGSGCLINVGAYLHHDVVIGDYCDVSPGAKILGRVKIGNNCSIGSGAVILPNVILGDNVTVGAGAVVVKNCLNEDTIIGVPGKTKNKTE
ncbi:NeuD/PglB/VioB family sugar acetyltransferase [Xanthomarina sp. F1114]|uniref:NeuD/PglB/VioB family sugar acetyltransferase n=1 Tax=Xanthomarina sp. F1114 TaxID=2996019 RepID=UPI00225E2111|nr:NeuD/PglB/VioB family sugar acetyltransferase [Xanthomarina sp. F1114]MCX7547126.1 NeuD/PglB/VioB family sugar acetyltransferase [Xanthomarina sp. F1114]